MTAGSKPSDSAAQLLGRQAGQVEKTLGALLIRKHPRERAKG
jgi:hypothetical protein